MADAKRVFTAVYIVITVGATWAAIASDRVSYPAWLAVGPAEFAAFHRAILAGTRAYLIPPALLSLILTIGMFWLRHPAISRGLVGVVLLCQLVGAFATVGMAIPLQIRMLHGPTTAIPDEIARLIATDLYFRVIPGVVSLIALCVMTHRISASGKPS